MRALARLFFSCVLFSVLGPAPAGAQDAADESEAVALFTSGTAGSAVSEAFVGLVPLPDEHRVDGFDAQRLRAAESDDALGYVISIATDLDLVQVLRRSDGARFERRFAVDAEDAYAMALVAAELLEVAKSGGDPEVLGLVATASVAGETPNGTTPSEGDESAPTEEASAEDGERATEDEAGAGQSAKRSWMLTLGAHAELWGSPAQAGVWLVQPGLFTDMLFRVGSLLVGGGLIASGFGGYGGRTEDVAATYRRYDLGGRVSVGVDVGALATRLLFHLRAGGSVVTADGRTITLATQQTRSESTGTAFLGFAIEARQPLVSGLSLHLSLGLDGLLSPVKVIAFEEVVATEGSLRLVAQLGICWVID